MSITILEFIRELNVEANRPRLEHTLCTFKSCAKCQAKFARARKRFHRSKDLQQSNKRRRN